MADTHGHDSDHHDSHDDVEVEDAVRTPGWLPFVGLGLLMLGSLWTYLWVYPGTMNTAEATTVTDGGTEGDASAAPAPAAGNPAPAPTPAH